VGCENRIDGFLSGSVGSKWRCCTVRQGKPGRRKMM
jgi:hypothetical protein